MDDNIIAANDRWRVRLKQDDCSCDDGPREWDNLGTMVCFHKRYTLGDEHSYDAETALENVLAEHEPDGVWALPLYLMDHSGISMSTSDDMFRACDSAGWDWGCVGFIYVAKHAMRHEFPSVRDDKILADKAKEIMQSEVNAYDQYLTGDVWGYVLEKKCRECGHWEHEDSCWGYYGHKYAEEEAQRVFDYQVEQEEVEQDG